MNQTAGRPPISDHDLLLVQVWLWAASSQSYHWAGSHQMLYKIHFSSHATIQLRNCPQLLHRKREDNTSKRWFLFWLSVISWGTHLPSFLAFPMCFKCWMTIGMVDVEFLGNFSCICKRISFNDGSQLVVVNFWWLAPALLIFKALSSFATLLKPSLLCRFIRSSWARCTVVSCLCCFTTHFELK